MNIAQAKRIPIEEYMLRFGHTPTRQSNRTLWYKSPFREESTPSFKVNQDRNAWYDFGSGQGGDLLDLVKHMQGTSSIAEALACLAVSTDGIVPRAATPKNVNEPTVTTEIVAIGPIESRSLMSYLESRAIDVNKVAGLVKEVHYRRGDREFFGIGFENNRNGFEIRTKEFKGSLGAKDISVRTGLTNNAFLFEGFLDFLSYVTMHGIPKETVIVLNSVSMQERAATAIRNMKLGQVEVFRDNDHAGEHLLEYLRQSCPNISILDRAIDYADYKDFNDWHQALQVNAKVR